MATRSRRGTSVETEGANETAQEVTSETSQPTTGSEAFAPEGTVAETATPSRRGGRRGPRGPNKARRSASTRFVATIEVQTTAEGLNDLSAIVESLSSDTSSASIKGIRPSK